MDDYKNYAYSTLAAGISAAATSCSVATGTGSRFPSTAFDAAIWDTSYSSATAAVLAGAGEQVRVGVRSTDTFPLTRAQGGTSAVALNTSGRTYAIAQVLTEGEFEKLASKVLVGTAMAALAIDTGNLVELNTKTVSADSTFTFSATPTTGKVFRLRLSEGGSAARTITIPSSYSTNRGAAITSFTLQASTTIDLVWHYDGSTYFIFNDPVSPAQQKTILAITPDDISGVMPVAKGGTGLDALGTAGQLLAVNATGDALEYVDPEAGSGDVTAASAFATDNRVIRSDGTSKGVQASSVEIDDSGNIGPVSDSIPNHVAFWDGHATAPKAVRFTAPTTVTTEYTVIWPAAPGTAGQILSVASVAGTTLTLQWSTP